VVGGMVGETPRQRDPLGHSAGQLGRKLVAVLWRQPDHFKLGGRKERVSRIVF